MIRHVLLDADGVVQRVRGGWREILDSHLGDRTDDFLLALPALELPSITGTGDFPAGLGPALVQHGIDADPEELYRAVWLAIESVEEPLALARSVRAGGPGVHLVTNQHPRRASYMKDTLGYDDVFDTCFYSCDLGVAKPDPAFFAAVLDRLGVEPAETLLVDDSAANVAAARDAGLWAEQWHLDEGHDLLRRHLAAYGVLPA